MGFRLLSHMFRDLVSTTVVSPDIAPFKLALHTYLCLCKTKNFHIAMMLHNIIGAFLLLGLGKKKYLVNFSLLDSLY